MKEICFITFKAYFSFNSARGETFGSSQVRAWLFGKSPTWFPENETESTSRGHQIEKKVMDEFKKDLSKGDRFEFGKNRQWKPEVIVDFYRGKGFHLAKIKTCGARSGFNEYMFIHEKKGLTHEDSL